MWSDIVLLMRYFIFSLQYKPALGAYIEIQSKNIEIYSATLKIHAKFVGLRYYARDEIYACVCVCVRGVCACFKNTDFDVQFF